MADTISKTSTHPPPDTNHELQLAGDFVRDTSCNIFLTGKAGTGKTTFLHNLQKNTAKRMIITAPTGVAAINAGGITLHSFFQLPFGPFVPGSDAYESNKQRQFRFSKEKKKIIKSLDLLVIDEISMVRSDLLDAVDAVLRRHRRNDLPFGGVQLLMIGDLYQLSPVVKQDEWQILQQHYESVYFFSSHSLDHTKLFTIELKHIYRQSDVHFIRLLNKVRDNSLDQATITSLNKHYSKDLSSFENQGYITLTTHNRSADSINRNRLSALTGKNFNFNADISGDFPEHIYPTQADLVLKQGAQVMFVRNDTSPDKLYYNGKIGKISKISDKNISVICPGEPKDIVVEPISWENIKYTMEENNREIKEDVIGTFKQYPLKLAWAITIHKSQGLTFEKAIIDARASFTHGQVYVALSRCKTLEGMVLSSPMSSAGIETDEAVKLFSENARQNPPSETQLQNAQITYQQNLLLDCFDFQLLRNRLNYFLRLLINNARVIHVSGISDVRQLEKSAVKDIFVTGENFKHQLRTIFENGNLPESDALILERISKASKWLQDKFTFIFGNSIQEMHIETDNKEILKIITNALDNLKQEICVKSAGMKSCEKGFSPSDYLSAVSSAEIEFAPEKTKKHQLPTFTKSDVDHPELFQVLNDWRYKKAKEKKIALFQILHQRVLIQIAIYLPDKIADLKKISGVGKKTIERYGEELVEIVSAYRKKHGIEKVMLPEPEGRKGRTGEKVKEKISPGKKDTSGSETQFTSFDMFKKGITIDNIAKERGLVKSTIEGHLAFFVGKGELDINRLIPSEKQKAIKDELAKEHNNSLSEVKQVLGDGFSYGEIRMMLAFQKYNENNQQNKISR